MTRNRFWTVGIGATSAVLAAATGAVLFFAPSNDDLAQRAEREMTSALGVKVAVGSLRWRVLPSPAVVVENVTTAQTPPLTIAKLTLYPDLISLWQRHIQIDLAELEGAVIPQQALAGLQGTRREGQTGKSDALQPTQTGFKPADVPLKRIVFKSVTWINRAGVAVIYGGDVDFAAQWRPIQARLSLPGTTTPADLSLIRQGLDDRWRVTINLAKGIANGDMQLQTQADGQLLLGGKLKLEGVEVASALTAFNRRPIIAGRASGISTITARGVNVGALAQSLHTQTLLAMSHATLLRFDLDKAIRSLGKDHAGQTPLDAIAGQIDTQNGPQGMTIAFSNIKARSGVFSASGNATLSNRHIDAEFAVDLVGGLVGIPLKVSGPTDQVVVSLPKAAIAGALAGTAVLPGVGTAMGARLGVVVEKLFGPPSAPAVAASAGARKVERRPNP